MFKKYHAYPDEKAYEYVMGKLKDKGVTADSIVDSAMRRQEKYMPEWDRSHYETSLVKVMQKRNILNNCMVGIHLDELATKGDLPEPLLELMVSDAGMFEVDEVLGIDIARDYGSIGVTNFGYLDCEKDELVKSLDADTEEVNTFTDDLVSGIIAAVCACTVHRYYETYVYSKEAEEKRKEIELKENGEQ